MKKENWAPLTQLSPGGQEVRAEMCFAASAVLCLQETHLSCWHICLPFAFLTLVYNIKWA